jgi:hypothetical protein
MAAYDIDFGKDRGGNVDDWQNEHLMSLVQLADAPTCCYHWEEHFELLLNGECIALPAD